MRDGPTFDRRSLLKTTGVLAGAGLLGVAGTGNAAAGHELSNDETDYETTHGVSQPEYELGAPEHFYAPTEFDHEGETESPQLYGEVIRPVDPETGEKLQDVPVILTYSPYNDLRSPNRRTPDALKLSGYDPTTGEPPEQDDVDNESTANDAVAQYYVQRGYARAMVDLVGTRNSQGTYDYGGIRERLTGKQLVEWLADQKWTNGKVGMIGGSYDGTTQWAAAIEQPEGLATIVPQVAIDRWYDYAYIGGVRFNSYGTPQLFDGGFALAPPLDADPEAAQTVVDRIQPGQRVQHEMESSEYDVLYDEFWNERDYLQKADQIECPVFAEAGWLDLNVEHWDTTIMWQALPDGLPKKLAMGQWAHATSTLEDARQVQHAWFDKWLMGLTPDDAPDVTDLPRVDTENNLNDRLQAEEFPPRGTQEMALPMVDSGPAAGELELLGTGQATYEDTLQGLEESDMMADRSSGDDHLMFETPPMGDSVRFIGTPVADLVATSTSTSAHFVGYLYQRNPDGSTERIASGALNAKNRKSLRRHDAIPTDRSFRVPLRLIDIDHEVPKGARLGLVVAADNTTRLRRDPDGDGTQSLVLQPPNGSGGSSLRLPITEGRNALGPNATPLPEVSVSRSDDGQLFTGGSTDQVTIETTEADRPVRLRDHVPEGWDVVGGDGTFDEDSRYVTFDVTKAGESVDYFAEAPAAVDQSGEYTFGPVEYSPDGGNTWLTLQGTTEVNRVVGTGLPNPSDNL